MSGSTMGSRPDNACRFDASAKGHVESYFWRLNDPHRPRALWLKATIFAPIEGAPIAEAWCVYFDGEKNRSWAQRDTDPLVHAAFPDSVSRKIRVAGVNFQVGPAGTSTGAIERGDEVCQWDLTWSRESGPFGDPLSLLPTSAMNDGPFPSSKTLTPCPALRFHRGRRLERHAGPQLGPRACL